MKIGMKLALAILIMLALTTCKVMSQDAQCSQALALYRGYMNGTLDAYTRIAVRARLSEGKRWYRANCAVARRSFTRKETSW